MKALLLVLLLSGCAGFNKKAQSLYYGQEEREVISALGKPDMTTTNPNGTSKYTWLPDYKERPYSYYTHFDSKKRLISWGPDKAAYAKATKKAYQRDALMNDEDSSERRVPAGSLSEMEEKVGSVDSGGRLPTRCFSGSKAPRAAYGCKFVCKNQVWTEICK